MVPRLGPGVGEVDVDRIGALALEAGREQVERVAAEGDQVAEPAPLGAAGGRRPVDRGGFDAEEGRVGLGGGSRQQVAALAEADLDLEAAAAAPRERRSSSRRPELPAPHARCGGAVIIGAAQSRSSERRRASSSTMRRTSCDRFFGTTSTALPDCTTASPSTPSTATTPSSVHSRLSLGVDRDGLPARLVAARHRRRAPRPAPPTTRDRSSRNRAPRSRDRRAAPSPRCRSASPESSGRSASRRAGSATAALTASAIAGSKRRRRSSRSSPGKTKIPAFHRWRPPATNAAAVAASGFSRKRTTRWRASRAASAAIGRSTSRYPYPVSAQRGRTPSAITVRRSAAAATAAVSVRAERVLVLDPVIGVERDDDVGSLCGRHAGQAPADRRRRVAAHRLEQDLLGRKLGQLAAHRLAEVARGADPDVGRRYQRRQPVEGQAQQAAVADQRQELLGTAAARRRPEARPATTREDERLQRLSPLAWRRTDRAISRAGCAVSRRRSARPCSRTAPRPRGSGR